MKHRHDVPVQLASSPGPKRGPGTHRLRMRQLFPYTVCILSINRPRGFAIIMLAPLTINFATSTTCRICILGDCKSNQFAHYLMIYELVYGEIYDVQGISVHFDACADSVYQALFLGLGTRLLYNVQLQIILDTLIDFDLYKIIPYMFVPHLPSCYRCADHLQHAIFSIYYRYANISV